MGRAKYHSYTQVEGGMETRTTRIRATMEMLKLQFGHDVQRLACEHGYFRPLQACIEDLLTRLLRCYEHHLVTHGSETMAQLCATPIRCVCVCFRHLESRLIFCGDGTPVTRVRIGILNLRVGIVLPPTCAVNPTLEYPGEVLERGVKTRAHTQICSKPPLPSCVTKRTIWAGPNFCPYLTRSMPSTPSTTEVCVFLLFLCSLGPDRANFAISTTYKQKTYTLKCSVHVSGDFNFENAVLGVGKFISEEYFVNKFESNSMLQSLAD